MDRIKSISKRLLRNEEWYRFHCDCRDLLQKFNPARLKVEEFIPPYELGINNAKEVLEWLRASDITDKLVELDGERDSLLSGLKSFVKAFANGFDANRKDAAGRIMPLINLYEGMQNRSYNEETAMIENFIYDMRTKFAEEVSTLSLTDWLTQVEQANQKFQAAYIKRNEDNAANKPETTMIEVRKAVDKVYDGIMKRIEALVEIEGEFNYLPFIKEWNAIIDKFRNTLAVRKGRNAKDKDVIIDNTNTL
jgi:hypothetical protein